MGWFAREILGNEPPPPTKDKTPRPLSDQDLEDFRRASERQVGMATYQEMLFVMSKFAGSDWVRIRRLRKDLRWLGKKAASLGIEWTDLSP
jgi:hypothetical protein